VDANQPQTAEKGENLENQLESTVYQFWDGDCTVNDW